MDPSGQHGLTVRPLLCSDWSGGRPYWPVIGCVGVVRRAETVLVSSSDVGEELGYTQLSDTRRTVQTSQTSQLSDTNISNVSLTKVHQTEDRQREEMAARLVTLLTVFCSSQSRAQLSHIRVSIDNEISASSCEASLASLHTLLTGARTELFNKTNINTERVTISLPRSWSSSPCVQGLSLTRPTPGAPDLVVLPSPNTEIRTVQYGGCGVRGKRIILPHQRVENSQNVTRDVTDLFISLLKYEFGYFDTQAPPSTANEVKFPESNKTIEMEAESCSRDPLNDKDYNTEAPTQQNLLCQEQSPLRLIKSGLISESEKSDVMAVVGRSPIVEYVISQKTRHLLVLDRSQQSKHVWKHLRNALYRYTVTQSQPQSVLLLDSRIELAISRNVIRGLSVIT